MSLCKVQGQEFVELLLVHSIWQQPKVNWPCRLFTWCLHKYQLAPRVLCGLLTWTLSTVCFLYIPDSIEANVETAESQVQSGTQQLARAADYQVRTWQRETVQWRKNFNLENCVHFLLDQFLMVYYKANCAFFKLFFVDLFGSHLILVQAETKRPLESLDGLSSLDKTIQFTMRNKTWTKKTEDNQSVYQ